MPQTSVVHYFASRKRPAVSDYPDHLKKCPKLTLSESKDVATIHSTTLQSPIDCIEKNIALKQGEQNSNEEYPRSNKKNIDNIKQCKPQSSGELDQVKKKISRSEKLKELTKSIDRFNKSTELLKVAEQKTKGILESPKLKSFKTLEFEVLVSPEKTLSPEKSYLSPKKESVRKNLFSTLSPTKKVRTFTLDTVPEQKTQEDVIPKSSLQLPFKYKVLHEIFRAVDTLVQLLYNRKEAITFKKVKHAVEEMIKRTFLEKHLAQIKSVYPNAYDFSQEKIKVHTSSTPQLQSELVLIPKISAEVMTAKTLLDRRTTFYTKLIDKVKDYHEEFLLSLTPPMVISKDNITRWHPEFDIDKVPDIQMTALPQAPVTQKYTSGREILENAHKLFSCNSRMNEALLKLKESSTCTSEAKADNTNAPTSVIQGIPKALLEKVRQRQAAKALVSMTRTPCKEKELQMYYRLPEIARLTRNLFVSEKKMVLELDVVVGKLSNSYGSFLGRQEMIAHLEEISKAVPGWLVFHKLRNSMFLKVAKNADFNAVLTRLTKLTTEKQES